MSTVEREDGVELYWRRTGEGPTVIIGDNLFSIPDALDGLEAELASDHTVVRYHPRGAGRSTRAGPFDLDTDVSDLAAIAAAAGGDAVVVGPANGGYVATVCAAARPELVSAVIAPTGVPIAAPRLKEGLAASREVLDAIGTQLASDYRGLVRTVTVTGNPKDTEEQHRHRVEVQVEYCPEETARGRWEAYYRSDPTEAAIGLGDRLWVLLHASMPWWPVELAGPLRELLPEAHVEVVEDGPVSRPDIVAGVVRGITGGNP